MEFEAIAADGEYEAYALELACDRESFAVYLRHLQPDGVLLANVSNRHLAVDRVVRASARSHGLACAVIDTPADAQAFYDELCHMLAAQVAAPNSPQWFNTGLHWAYGLTGPAQGHHYVDADTQTLTRAEETDLETMLRQIETAERPA